MNEDILNFFKDRLMSAQETYRETYDEEISDHDFINYVVIALVDWKVNASN